MTMTVQQRLDQQQYSHLHLRVVRLWRRFPPLLSPAHRRCLLLNLKAWTHCHRQDPPIRNTCRTAQLWRIRLLTPRRQLRLTPPWQLRLPLQRQQRLNLNIPHTRIFQHHASPCLPGASRPPRRVTERPSRHPALKSSRRFLGTLYPVIATSLVRRATRKSRISL